MILTEIFELINKIQTSKLKTNGIPYLCELWNCQKIIVPKK